MLQQEENQMKVVYVAGPFRARTPWLIEQNVRKAEEASARVALLGAVPLCPHTMYRHFDKMLPDKFWLESTLELLRRCDAILLVKGWEESSGSVSEHEEAGKLKIPVFHDTLEDFARLGGWIYGAETEPDGG